MVRSSARCALHQHSLLYVVTSLRIGPTRLCLGYIWFFTLDCCRSTLCQAFSVCALVVSEQLLFAASTRDALTPSTHAHRIVLYFRNIAMRAHKTQKPFAYACALVNDSRIIRLLSLTICSNLQTQMKFSSFITSCAYLYYR